MGRFWMARSLMVVATEVRVVSTVGASAVTICVSTLTPPTTRPISYGVLPPTVTGMWSCENVWKPGALALRV
jgi:hypothetical protein